MNSYLPDLIHGLDAYTRAITPHAKLEALADLRKVIKQAELAATRSLRIQDLDHDDDDF